MGSRLRIWVQDLRRDVIRMMRLKFICMAMTILLLVFLIMLGSINMIMQTVSRSQSLQLLRQIAASDRYNSLEPAQEAAPHPEQPPAETVSVQPPAENISVQPLAYGRNERFPEDDRQPPTLPEGETFAPGWGEPPEQRPPQGWGGEHGQFDIPPSEYEPPDEDGPEEKDEDDPEEKDEDDDPEEDPTERKEPPEETVSAPAQPETVPVQATEAAQNVSETEILPSETGAGTETVSPTPPAPANDPPFPKEPRPDRWNVPITIDHFAVLADAEGHFLGLRNTEDYTDEEAATLLAGILAQDKEEGMYGWLQYCRAEKPYGTLLVITDKTSDQGLLNGLFRTTVILGTLMLLALLVVVIVLSRWITAPVQHAFQRQKQFVSDAGHELKTPLAVLTTNADLLQDELGENKWLVYMQEQITRMDRLVGDLLRLARMDNAAQEYTMTDLDLSLAVAASVLPFEGQAFESGRTLETDIQPEITYRGSETHIRQLCAIFMDNALKYSNENGIIKVTLLRKGDHAVLEFYNTGCDITQEEVSHLFERFYRGDKARSNAGKSGYGLGLAIAKSIMDIHRIRIQVTCEQDAWIRFLLIF